MKKKMEFENPAIYELIDILRDIAVFEHNNECEVVLRHDENLNVDSIYLHCVFKDTNGRRKYIRKYIYMTALHHVSLQAAVAVHLEELEMEINRARDISVIRFSLLINEANKRDFLGDCIVTKTKDGEIIIKCHDAPTYYGDGIEQNPDDFLSLFCTIKDGVIIRTWRLNSKFEGYKVECEINDEEDEDEQR